MNKPVLSFLIISITVIILSGCNNIALTNSDFSSGNQDSVKSKVVAKSSVFDFMKEKNIDELLLTDGAGVDEKMLQAFIAAIQGYYYGEDFLNSINTKSIFAYNVCSVVYNEESNIYGVTDTIFDCIIARESENTMDIRFNSIKVTDQENKYQVFDKDNPNEERTVFFIVSGSEVTKIMTPTGNYTKMNMTLDDFINTKNLSGEYRDQNNKTYRFTSDKQAIWPDQSFSYVILDFNYPECNDFWEECNPICVIDKDTKKATGKYYGYKFVNDELYIYNVRPGEPWGYYPEEKPVLVLHK